MSKVTIEVSKEMHDALMIISNELNTQDHLCTRMPYMIQKRESKEVAAYEDCGESIWVCSEGMTLRDVNEVLEYLKSHGVKDNLEDWHLLDLDEFDDELLALNNGWRMIEVTQEDQLENFFFTHKGIKKYYGEDTKTYLTGVRNPELETVMKFLCELSGGKLHT